MSGEERSFSGRFDSTCDPKRFKHLIRHINDAIVEFEIVDGEPVVLDINQSFVEIFGVSRSEAVGASINDLIVPEWLSDEARELDSRTADGSVNHRKVKRQAADGLCEFLYRGVPYDVDGERTRGFAIYTDVTEIRRRGRRLQVLSRLFRHNVRNELTIIGGLTETIAANHQYPAVVERKAEALQEAVQSLHQLAEEAEEINRTLRDFSSSTAGDCIPSIGSLVGQYRADFPDAKIETELPESQPLVAVDRCEVAVAQLIDNAIRHNPAERPYVRVRVSSVAVGDWVDIVVEDDGPVIPQTERSVLTGESEIDQISHGSGLGLWLVKWTVEKAGGQLSFEERSAGGNRIRLRLPTGTNEE